MPAATDSPAPLFVDARSVADLLTPLGVLATVERAFSDQGLGGAGGSGAFHLSADRGVFHVKGGSLGGSTGHAGVKVNSRYPGPDGRERVAGLVLLHDLANGSLAGAVASPRLTVLRTAAAAVVALRHLAVPGAGRVAVLGCGAVGSATASMVLQALGPHRLDLWSRNPAASSSLADELGGRDGVDVRSCATADEAVRGAGMVVTCTPSTGPLFRGDAVVAGAVVAAMGADAAGKQELPADLVAGAVVVTDVSAQSVAVGELSHQGEHAQRLVRTELGPVVAGRAPGRAAPEERIVFDSTGAAFLDVAVATELLRAARAAGLGVPLA
jgi:ornithine cyclodeaminase